MWPSTSMIGSLYIVKIAGLANCFRIASTSFLDGPSYFRGLWLHGGSATADRLAADFGPAEVRGGAVILLRGLRCFRLRGRGVTLDRLVATLVVCGVGTADRRLQHHAIAPGSPEVLQRVKTVLLEELAVLLVEALDHVRTHRLIEHRGRAHLDGSASEGEVARRLRHVGDSA